MAPYAVFLLLVVVVGGRVVVFYLTRPAEVLDPGRMFNVRVVFVYLLALASVGVGPISEGGSPGGGFSRVVEVVPVPGLLLLLSYLLVVVGATHN